eukprot:scaffold11849_cov130-Isochrysis_galbana.AAC.2
MGAWQGLAIEPPSAAVRVGERCHPSPIGHRWARATREKITQVVQRATLNTLMTTKEGRGYTGEGTREGKGASEGGVGGEGGG